MTKHEQKIKERVKNARHQSKPDAPNTTVFLDGQGRWLFELYSPKEK